MIADKTLRERLLEIASALQKSIDLRQDDAFESYRLLVAADKQMKAVLADLDERMPRPDA